MKNWLVSQEKVRARLFTRRAALLGGGKLLLLSTLVGRMYQLQVVEAPRFSVLAEENRINLRLLPPLRGRIYDRFGVPLAENDQNYQVVVVPEQAGDLAQVLNDLSRFIPLSEEDRRRIIEDARRRRAFVPVNVTENLSWHEVAAVEVNAPDLPGVSIEVGQRRRYPLAGIISHAVGYVAAVAESDLTGDPLLELPGFRIGKSGIERQYETALRGKAGTSQVEVNAVGRVIREVAREEGVPGEDLVISIDSGLQNFVQQRLAGELSASSVVLDVHSGEVLAMGSTPTYDPAMFTRGLTTREWRTLISDPLHPLINKTINAQYAPGSTFKMMVAMAALEAGVSPTKRVFCPGFYTLGDARYHCWRRGGHGSLDMWGGLMHSCDVFFYDTAYRVGIDAIAATARKFGLGHVTEVDLPGEQPGLIPDRDWKEATFGEPWYPGETPVAGIGQGFITVTPLQLAVMTARIANGGRAILPHLRRDGVASGTLDPASVAVAPSMDLPEAHLAVLQEGMRRVTNERGGTAYRVRIDEPGMEMAGKTGTAQVRRITMRERQSGVRKNKDIPWDERDHALFVGYAPVAAPQYAVAVVVEHGGGGSSVAGPIARDIMIETQRRNPSRIDMAQRLALAEKR